MDPSPSPATTPLAEGAQISRGTAATLTAAFLVLIGLPAAHQTLNLPEVQARRFRTLLTQVPTAGSLSDFEAGLTEESSLAKSVRQRFQALVFRGLGQGNHKITVGREGFLFLRQDIDLCAGTGLMRRANGFRRHPSLATIPDYSARLAERGIHLVVVPVPVAPAVYPEKAWPGYPLEAGPANNADYAAWLAGLHSAGVDVVDLTSAYWRERSQRDKPLFLKRNSHWTPHGIVMAAREVGARVRPFVEGIQRDPFTTQTTTCVLQSELVPMLDLPPTVRFRPMRHNVTRVLSHGEIATGDADSAVILLGDSLSHMLTGLSPVDDCGGGSLAQHLMLDLGVSVQSLVVVGATPTDLRLRLAEQKGALRGKRVLVWEFTTRYLHKDHLWSWRNVQLPPD